MVTRMARSRPTLLRRLFPAVALTGVGVGMVHALDRPVSTPAAMAPDTTALTTTVPLADTTTIASQPTNQPQPVVPAPTTTQAPAQQPVSTCGTTVTTGEKSLIYERRQYGLIWVTAKFNAAGKLCKVSADYQVYDNRSQRYEAYAVPILNKQAMSVRSAGIQGISGATAVSRAYARSLQSAIDQKG